MRRGLAVAGMVALALGVVGAYVLWTRRAVPVEMHRAPVEPARWKRYRAAVEAAPAVEGPEAERLAAALVATHRAEVAGGDVPAATARLQAAALHLVEMRGADSYLDAGRRHGLALVDALDRLLAHARRADRSIAALLAERPPAPVVQAAVDAGGAFVLHAERAGLVVDGTVVTGPAIVQAVFLERWLALVRARRPADAYLHPEELEWIHRWQVEWNAAAPLDRRLAAADALRAVQGYPADLNAGVLLYRAGRFAEAARRFAVAPGPRAVAYRRMAERAAAR